MELLINILVNGFVSGGIYSLLAIGFSLIFGVGRILNLAHTAYYMVTGYIMYIFIAKSGIPHLISPILAIIIVSIGGALSYKFFFDRVKERETAVIIVSVAQAMVFQEVFLIAFGGQYLGIAPFFPGFIDIASVRVPYQGLFGILIAIITLVGLWMLLSKTKLGNAIRTVSQDMEVAGLVGINVSRVCMITMSISVAIGGIATFVAAPIFMLSPLMWIHPLVVVLAAVLLGGLGSLKGSVIGGFMLGFAEVLVVFLIPGGSFLQGAASLSVMIIVLLLKPEGLFGVFFEEEKL